MEHRVSVDGNFTGAINFAMQQNYVPVIRNLIVRNETEEVLSDLDVRIRFEPDFAREYQYFIQEIPAGEAVEISPVRIQLKTEYLFSLTGKSFWAWLWWNCTGRKSGFSFWKKRSSFWLQISGTAGFVCRSLSPRL